MTSWGRHVLAIGGNEQAALLTGVPVNRIKVRGLRRLGPGRVLRGDPGCRLGGIGDQRARGHLRTSGDLGRGDRRRQSHGRRSERLRRLHRRGAHFRHPQFAADGGRRFELAGHVRRRVPYCSGLSRKDPRSETRVTPEGARVKLGGEGNVESVVDRRCGAGGAWSPFRPRRRRLIPIPSRWCRRTPTIRSSTRRWPGARRRRRNSRARSSASISGPESTAAAMSRRRWSRDLVTKKVDGIAVSAGQRSGDRQRAEGRREDQDPGAHLGLGPPAAGQGVARRLCRNAQL